MSPKRRGNAGLASPCLQSDKENVGVAPSCLQNEKENAGLAPSWLQNDKENVGLAPSWLQNDKENAGLAPSCLENDQKMQVWRHQASKTTRKCRFGVRLGWLDPRSLRMRAWFRVRWDGSSPTPGPPPSPPPLTPIRFCGVLHSRYFF